MDLRIERTRRSIVNAFIELRAKKDLEKITVKELAEKAYINKATFYAHYQDIYDLSEQLEDDLIREITTQILIPENLRQYPHGATQILAFGFLTHKSLIDILFSGSRSAVFVTKFERWLKEALYEIDPEMKYDFKKNIALSYLVQGSFHIFMDYSDTLSESELVQIVDELNQRILKS